MRLVHQFWLQGVKRCPRTRESLAAQPWGPNVKHHLWDEVAVTALIEVKYPQWLSFWLRLPHLMIKCDVARAFILHAFGGVYADLDYEPTTEFQEIWDQPLFQVKVGRYQRLLPTYRIPNNAWILSPPSAPFWLDTFLPEVEEELNRPRFLTVIGQMIMGSWWHVLSVAGPVAWARWVQQGKVKALDYEDVYIRYGIHGKNKTEGWVVWNELKMHIVLFTLVLFFLPICGCIF